jgi:hypothetical protein
MLKDSEKFLNDLNNQNTNLMEIMKIETDVKKLKDLEKDINKNHGLIKVLTQYINYYRMKIIKSKE